MELLKMRAQRREFLPGLRDREHKLSRMRNVHSMYCHYRAAVWTKAT